MTVARHHNIGVKQVIRLEWMQHTTRLLLAGLAAKGIRQALHDFIDKQRHDVHDRIPSAMNRSFAVNNLMKIWVSPAPELIPFRDASLACLRENPSMALSLHWGMVAAAYPFWFNVARQTGRLLALQEQVTQAQIIHRLKEQYGDRQTIFRYSRYVLRSFVVWGVLLDTGTHGCYAKAAPLTIADNSQAALLYESALWAAPDAKMALGLLQNNPGFFPFQLPALSGHAVSLHNQRLDVARYGLDDELLTLKGNRIKPGP
jgi:hypothetical protein